MTYWRLQCHNLERVAMEGQQWGNPGLLGPGQVCPMGWALLNFIPSHLGTPLGVVVEVFHLLPLSDGFLACAADVVSSLPPCLPPTPLLRLQLSFRGARARANTSFSVSWRSCLHRVNAFHFRPLSSFLVILLFGVLILPGFSSCMLL